MLAFFSLNEGKRQHLFLLKRPRSFSFFEMFKKYYLSYQ